MNDMKLGNVTINGSRRFAPMAARPTGRARDEPRFRRLLRRRRDFERKGISLAD
jgi:hypothetical protein